ncbi:hypothetical protein [Amycolatopsis samaneae]|uniref:Extracellular repeat, HAF family n=1 Tax=Amycolatopsis samaneae TaxID=664691 RepID=A0ABW5GP97_9PSEU
MSGRTWGPRSRTTRRTARLAGFAGVVALSVTGGGVAAAPSAEAATPHYTLTVAPDAVQRFTGINDNGDIIGIGLSGSQAGFVIKAGTTTPVFLSTAADPGNAHQFTDAHAINGQGMVVGDIFPAGGPDILRAARWPSPGATGVDLGVDPAQPFFDVEATGINDSGLIAGRTVDPAGKVTAWTVNGSTITRLPFLPGGAQARARAVNNAGLVVGGSAVSASVVSAAAWQHGRVRDLGVLPGGNFAEAVAVNSAGVAVGVSNNTPSGEGVSQRAVRFSGGTVTDLNIPGTGPIANSTANDINDSGVIVGALPSGGAYVYRDGTATDLNTLVPAGTGFHITNATAINNKGAIVGTAQKGFGGRTFGVLLTPAP